MVDDENEDTLTYHAKNTFVYRPEKNGGDLTGDEVVILPHPCKKSFYNKIKNHVIYGEGPI